MHGIFLKHPECKTFLISFLNRVRETDIDLPFTECRNNITARERTQAQIDARCMCMKTLEQWGQTETEQ